MSWVGNFDIACVGEFDGGFVVEIGLVVGEEEVAESAVGVEHFVVDVFGGDLSCLDLGVGFGVVCEDFGDVFHGDLGALGLYWGGW